ncbi:hypothetical protein DFA_03527 [Cavenderia fasciculata]|uniref:Saposin B-type domain-containing protein n=1 Tax=Cavenderia fasciculata TaxID=261658 RepID=F4PHU5_CACFS|nr:uncharacterized protein DFA_03527 [Cavenderia fasciculata]EGG25279.1 hypothetical protein DFA_03527 [Cavenderia fasciculata]|eukprot:XP_004363130.1 hypothetical protein DFA_03527 [Cavenderia fasciculata]
MISTKFTQSMIIVIIFGMLFISTAFAGDSINEQCLGCLEIAYSSQTACINNGIASKICDEFLDDALARCSEETEIELFSTGPSRYDKTILK